MYWLQLQKQNCPETVQLLSQNVDDRLPTDTALYPRETQFSATLLRKPRHWHALVVY